MLPHASPPQVLHLEDPPELAPLDDAWRYGGCTSQLKQLLGLYEGGTRRPRSGGLARWRQLWKRRRRGLVRERIKSEHDDYIARIKELEEHTNFLEYELACARGVHPSIGNPYREETINNSLQHAGGSMSVDAS